MIHFGKPYLSLGRGLFYRHSSNWSLCGKYKSTDVGFNNILSSDFREVTCKECLSQMSCDHNWKYLYTGRHGSDKGDDYYECTECKWYLQNEHIWEPGKDKKFIERAWEGLNIASQKELAFSNFKVFQWTVKDE